VIIEILRPVCKGTSFAGYSVAMGAMILRKSQHCHGHSTGLSTLASPNGDLEGEESHVVAVQPAQHSWRH